MALNCESQMACPPSVPCSSDHHTERTMIDKREAGILKDCLGAQE